MESTIMCVYETIFHPKINGFENWLHVKTKYHVYREFSDSNKVKILLQEQNRENLEKCKKSHRQLFQLMDEYDQYLCNSSDPMNKF